MVCDKANTTCTISLGRANCKSLSGWTEYCEKYYQSGNYSTCVHQTVWQRYQPTFKNGTKNQKKVWVRMVPREVGCAKAMLGHGMMLRKEIIQETVPFTGDPITMLAEGHAFRKSLCEGKQIKGFEWLGPNRMFNNGTCQSPAEHRMRCGTGFNEHECTWAERVRILTSNGLTTLIEETVEVIGEGVKVVGGWLSELLFSIWPYLLLGLGLLISVVFITTLMKGGVKTACSRRMTQKSPTSTELGKPRLTREEGSSCV